MPDLGSKPTIFADRPIDPKRLIGTAIVGTLTLEALLLFSAGATNTYTIRQLPSHVLALVVGTLGGWIFELFRQLLNATAASLAEFARLNASLTGLTQRIDYQDTALNMLTSCPRHNGGFDLSDQGINER
jgi:MFS superfamily sulfate permease-like transporter